MGKVKIGFLPLYVKLYDDGAPGMRERVNSFTEEIKTILKSREDVLLVSADICRLEDEFAAAVAMFEKEKVDSIVTLHLAYSPSLQSEKVLKSTSLPIVILDTTPTYAFTTDDDAAVISYNHGIHGVQDMCNLLVRNKKQFFIEAGHYKESDVIDRTVARVKGIAAANSFKSARVGSIGGSFAGMGDFIISDAAYKALGIETTVLTPEMVKEIDAKITEDEVTALVESDRARYNIDETLTEKQHRTTARGSLVIRRWLEENKLTAFTANFLKVDKAFGIGGMPFSEANRAMERGIGYAGEGDTLNAALVGALMSVSDEASFIEMFCPDWKNNMIFISHMGEMNTSLAHAKPTVSPTPMKYSDIDTVKIHATYKAGTATLISLVPIADDKFRIVTSLVEMKVPECPKLNKNQIKGWFAPQKSVADFLCDYTKLGGPHHLSLMYGDARKTAETFAGVLGFEYFEI